MSDSEHDDDFDAYLKRRVPIHKGGTPADRLEPPPELDRIIIGNARKAIQGAAPVQVYRAPKWALAVGLAATIVISFAVVLELGLRAKHAAPPPNEPVETDLVAEAPSPDVVSAPAMALHPAPTLEEPSVAKPAGAAKSAGHRGAPRSPQRIRLPAIPTVPWPPATAPNMAPTVAADAGEQADGDKARTRLARAEAAAARSRSDLEEGVPTGGSGALSAEGVTPRASGASGAEGMAPLKPSGTSSAQRAPTGASRAAGAEGVPTGTSGASGAEPVPVAPAPEAYAAAKSAAADSNDSGLEESVVTRRGSLPRPASPAPVPPRPAHPDPATWLSQIEKLRGAGQTAAAERQLKLFHELYPDYPVPGEAASTDGRAQ